MKKLFVILFLIYGTVYGQTVKVATSTSLTAPVVYTQAGTDAAIKAAIAAYASKQTVVDTDQNKRISALEASVATLKLNDTIFFEKRYFTVLGKSVLLNIDSVSKYVKVTVPPPDLTAINNSIASLTVRVTALEMRVASNEVRIVSLEQWRTQAQNQLDKISAQIAAIPPVPTTATSTSTSTTTTTTTTILK